MPFTDKAKMLALAIVHVFEASKPLGDYAALVVLDDGAGVSYGMNQFTHRSGSLLAVVERYLANGGTVGKSVLDANLPALKNDSSASIAALSRDVLFKNALKSAASTPEMRSAQQSVMVDRYLTPAIAACEGSHFTLPLSLACIYDSINHGSFGLIRDQVTVDRSTFASNTEFEKAWIGEYCRLRLKWIKSKRGSLRNTVYRPQFFQTQIEAGNWSLDLPFSVHGVKLTEAMFKTSAAAPSQNTAIEQTTSSPTTDPAQTSPTGPSNNEQPPINTASEDEADGAANGDAQGQPDKVAVEKEPEPVGFIAQKKAQLTGWVGTIGGLEGLRQYHDDIASLGLPAEIMTYAVIAVIAAFVLWLLYSLAKHIWKQISQRWLTTSLIAANATSTNQVIVASADKLGDLEKAGWNVVRRQ